MKPALLVIDMQEAFFEEGPSVALSLADAVMYINAAISLFRAKDLPIIVIEDLSEEEGRVPGSKGFETTSRINLSPNDVRVHKTYGNAFNKTNLHQELQNLGVDTLILTGFAATQCVTSTYRGALDLDYDTFVFRGSLADSSPERVRFVEEIHDLLSYKVLVKLISLTE
ncbi:MAG: cysteine hydrolase family protein [Anaerolineales bacterium]|jgi:nicotinamidase-related amidase